MEQPVFKLEKAIRTRSDQPQDFEGPLDLILFLLSRNRMDIQDISIALICDQYIAWLETRQGMDLEVASDFVSMASHLVYLKTRMLLSIEEAAGEVDALIESLEARRRDGRYAAIQQAAKQLAPMGEFGREIVTRNPETEPDMIYEYRQKPSDLLRAMAQIRLRSERALPPPRAAFRDIVQYEPYPVEDKARELLQRIRESGTIRFPRLFRGCQSRSEIVATFLAVLELCRAHMLCLRECLVSKADPPDRSLFDETEKEQKSV